MDVAGQVIQVIDALAAKLGVAAEYVYPLMIRQAFVDGVIHAICTLIGIVVICASCFMLKYYCFDTVFDDVGNKRTRYDIAYHKDVEMHIALLLTLGVVASAVSLIYAMVVFGEMVTAFANPEWYAIQKILRMVK